MTALSTRDALGQVRESLNAIISHHAPHGFDGVMRTADQGCQTYLLAIRALDALGAVVDAATLADDLQFVNTVAQGMTLQAFEDMALSDVLDARRTAGTAIRALAAALSERAS